MKDSCLAALHLRAMVRYLRLHSKDAGNQTNETTVQHVALQFWLFVGSNPVADMLAASMGGSMSPKVCAAGVAMFDYCKAK